MEYNKYLQTEHWKKTRSLKLEIKSACQVCDSNSSLQIHHKRYKDKQENTILFKENLTDLITLCASCHRLIHSHFGINVKKINKKILRVKSLLKLGVLKDKAFWLVARPNLYEYLYIDIRKEVI